MQAYASEHSISFRPLAEPSFILPASLTKIDADAFSGIRAEGVVIPKGVTEITGNPFSGSSVQLICGYAGSAAEKFASDYGFDFVAVNDAWIANR